MLQRVFDDLKSRNRAALITFLSCGDPNLDFSRKLAGTLCQAGADILELGVPFSDPMADGPSIQAAARRALASGTKLESVLEMACDLRKSGIDKGLIVFSYFNPIFKCGVKRAFAKAAECGVDGFLIVDLPLEEMGEVSGIAKSFGIDIVPLAAPTSPAGRIRKISEAGSGFLYYVTVAGVTGARDRLPSGFSARMNDVRRASLLPVAAGFGISNPEMAKEAALCSDAVVVGSRIVDMAHSSLVSYGEQAALESVSDFVASISAQMVR